MSTGPLSRTPASTTQAPLQLPAPTQTATPAKVDTPTYPEGVQRAGVRAHLDTFFDTNRDRRITLGESYAGLRRLGLGRLPAGAAALAINVGLARQTGGSLTTVELDGIADAKHKGDSGIIDDKGHFVPEKFEAMMAYGKTVPNALTEAEVTQFRKDNLARDETGSFEQVAALGEFGLLFKFGAQEVDGQRVLTRDRLHDFYHGNLFETLAQEHSAKVEARSGTVGGQVRNLIAAWFV